MYKEVTKCRCCGGSQLHKYLDLGNQPLANSYHKNPDEPLPEFPLEVMLCKQCFHSQLSIVVDPELMFKHYLYVSGTSQTFHLHCEKLAEEAFKEYHKTIYSDHEYKPPIVLDIACNDGTLLTCFRNLDCRVCGVDPAENLRTFTQEKDIPVLVDYWGKDIVDKVLNFLDSTFKVPFDKEKQIKADIITATNVFAHVDDTEGFLQACQKVLSPNGLVVIEFPYCDEMIEHVEFDTVYHEHLSYFTFNSFSTLANRMNFVIENVTQTKIHGGSIRFFLKPKKNSTNTTKYGFFDLVRSEKDKGLYNLETYIKFSEKVDKNKIDLNYMVDSLRETTGKELGDSYPDSNMKVIGFAASAKGNTMLNHFKIKLDYIVDENPLKVGYFTPGMNIPIYSMDVLKKEKGNLAIVILAWNFYDEIKEKIKKIRPINTDILVKYVPFVHDEKTMVRWD